MPVVSPQPLSNLTQATTALPANPGPAATATTPAPPPTHVPPPTGPKFLSTIEGVAPWIIIGAVVVFVILLVAYLVVSRRMTKARAARRLDDALAMGEYLGLIYDESENLVRFVPLRRVRGFYVSVDPRRPVIVVPNKDASTPILEGDGKPVVYAVSAGDIEAIQENPDILQARLGLASLAVKKLDNVDYSQHPSRAVMEAITEILRLGSDVVSVDLRVNPDTVIAFQIKKTGLVKAILHYVLGGIHNTLTHLANASESMDQLALMLKQMQVEQKMVRYSGWTILGMILLMALLIGGVVYAYFIRGGGP